MASGKYLAGSVSSCSRNTPSGVIFALIWRSALQETPMPTGRLAPWRGRRITRTSWQKYLPPNCAPMPMLRRQLQHLLLHLEVAEGVAGPAAGGRQRVEPLRRRELHGLQRGLGAGAADDDGEVVGRAGGGAERLHLGLEEFQPASRATGSPASPGTGTSCWPSRRPWRRTSDATRRHGRSPGLA